MKQIFLHNYRYAKNISEHFFCFSLWKSILPLHQGTGIWQKTYSSPTGAPCGCSPQPPQQHLLIINLTSRSQDKETYFLLWNANLALIYWGKWQFWLSSLYTVNILYTCNNDQQKALIFLGIPCHGKVRCSLILPAKLAQSRVLQSWVVTLHSMGIFCWKQAQ